jgi:hypothetical protein
MQISRLELYELVSSSPLSKVAPSLGISAMTLAAICREHGVPYPGSGYWTRKSLGQAVNPEPLPPAIGSEQQSISIEPRKTRALRPQARTGDAHVEELKSIGQIAPPSAASIARERPTKPHPIIAKWLVDHERRRREAIASRDPWQLKRAPAPLSDLDHRRHRILDLLFRALEAKGAKISEAEKGLLRVTIDGETIDFQIREKNRQVRVAPGDSRSSYLSQELVGTGKLVFAIRTYLRGPYNEEWRESDSDPLENQLPKMVDRFFEGGRILKAWRMEQEQEQERWRQAAARKAERDRQAKQEQSRRQRLAELARDWHTSNQIRDFIAAIKSKPFDGEKDVHAKSLEDWIAWAEAIAHVLDSTRDGAEGLFSIIGALKVEQ